MKKLNKKEIILISVVGIIFIILGIFLISYNDINTKKKNTNKNLSDIEIQIERRVGLIPNLINTIMGYTNDTSFTSDLMKHKKNLSNALSLVDKSKANLEFTDSLNKFYSSLESYPELLKDEDFIYMKEELDKTEKQINVVCNEYNLAVNKYNDSIDKFPNNLVAKLLRFNKKEYFDACK